MTKKKQHRRHTGCSSPFFVFYLIVAPLRFKRNTKREQFSLGIDLFVLRLVDWCVFNGVWKCWNTPRIDVITQQDDCSKLHEIESEP